MGGLYHWEWLLLELLVLAVAIYELASVWRPRKPKKPDPGPDP